jgi:hypothetical protein
MIRLSEAQTERYSRQIILPEIGARRQRRLLDSWVVVRGAGMLARTVALYLTGAGVGRLDLHCGRAEAAVLFDDLADVNPDVTVRVSWEDCPTPDGDVLVDVEANPTRLEAWLRAASLDGRRLLAAGTAGSRGWLAVPGREGRRGCPVCIAREAGTHDAPRGDPLAGALVGTVGSLLSLEVLASLLDWDPGREGRWLQFDAEAMSLEERQVPPHRDCGLCAGR